MHQKQRMRESEKGDRRKKKTDHVKEKEEL